MIKSLLLYVWKEKKWWLLPPMIIFILFGLLIVFSSTSPIGAFIYPFL